MRIEEEVEEVDVEVVEVAGVDVVVEEVEGEVDEVVEEVVIREEHHRDHGMGQDLRSLHI